MAQRWRVIGAKRDTGEDVDVEMEGDRGLVELTAVHRGILIETITEVNAPPAVPIDYAGAPPRRPGGDGVDGVMMGAGRLVEALLVEVALLPLTIAWIAAVWLVIAGAVGILGAPPADTTGFRDDNAIGAAANRLAEIKGILHEAKGALLMIAGVTLASFLRTIKRPRGSGDLDPQPPDPEEHEDGT